MNFEQLFYVFSFFWVCTWRSLCTFFKIIIMAVLEGIFQLELRRSEYLPNLGNYQQIDL